MSPNCFAPRWRAAVVHDPNSRTVRAHPPRRRRRLSPRPSEPRASRIARLARVRPRALKHRALRRVARGLGAVAATPEPSLSPSRKSAPLKRQPRLRVGSRTRPHVRGRGGLDPLSLCVRRQPPKRPAPTSRRRVAGLGPVPAGPKRLPLARSRRLHWLVRGPVDPPRRLGRPQARRKSSRRPPAMSRPRRGSGRALSDPPAERRGRPALLTRRRPRLVGPAALRRRQKPDSRRGCLAHARPARRPGGRREDGIHGRGPGRPPALRPPGEW
jgi:hypothetical protein